MKKNKKNKYQWRQYFLEIRKNITDEEKKKQSQDLQKKIKKNLLDLSTEKTSSDEKKNIAIFAGTPEEPDIIKLLKDKELQSFFSFCFPRITNFKNGEMEFFTVTKISDCIKNKFGILEPLHTCKKISSDKISIFFIPAVSIDKKGNRIGMGGGFYDRYLSRKNNAKKIGVIFEEQKSNFDFEVEPWDISVDVIL